LKRRSVISGVRNSHRTPACTVQSRPRNVLLPITPTPGSTYTFQWSSKRRPIPPCRFNVVYRRPSQSRSLVAKARTPPSLSPNRTDGRPDLCIGKFGAAWIVSDRVEVLSQNIVNAVWATGPPTRRLDRWCVSLYRCHSRFLN